MEINTVEFVFFLFTNGFIQVWCTRKDKINIVPFIFFQKLKLKNLIRNKNIFLVMFSNRWQCCAIIEHINKDCGASCQL